MFYRANTHTINSLLTDHEDHPQPNKTSTFWSHFQGRPHNDLSITAKVKTVLFLTILIIFKYTFVNETLFNTIFAELVTTFEFWGLRQFLTYGVAFDGSKEI